MIQLYDVGSIPFKGDLEKFSMGVRSFNPLMELLYGENYSSSLLRLYFEEKVIEGFFDKVKAGVDIPNYPQFRDMNKMFLERVDGVERTNGAYAAAGSIFIRSEKAEIPEISVLRKRASEIYEKIGNLFRLKICITGPYTLFSTFFPRRDEILIQLGDVVSRIVENNIFSNKYCDTELLVIDEPIFDVVDDPRLDYGSEGRECLLKAWESIFHKAKVKSRDIKTCIHLHSTSNDLFWELKSLDVVESHVNDLLYRSKKTKKFLEEKDKFLKASISTTNFNTLIRNRILAGAKEVDEAKINSLTGDVWTDIYRGKINPILFLETVNEMKKRLANIINMFGEERVPYAGPECGLKSFPTYESALECLKRTSKSIKRQHNYQGTYLSR